jgi:hypothetical protein
LTYPVDAAIFERYITVKGERASTSQLEPQLFVAVS